jgi:heterodisulfide reductase subunit B
MKLSYYPGCTLKTKARALDEAGRQAAHALGIELEELEEWQCCGAVYPQAADEIATRLSSIRALAAAKAKGQDLITLCSACHHVLKRVNHDMKTNEFIRLRANNYLKLDEPYRGEAKVVHYLEMLRDRVGFDAIRKAVTNPLKGRKIAAFYGCLLLRPSQVMAFDNPENPSIMEDFLCAVGAEPVFFPLNNECCGGYLAMEDRAQAKKQVARILDSAALKGAEAVITACPLCLYNLKENAAGHNLPVVYFTELLAEALGVKEGPQ